MTGCLNGGSCILDENKQTFKCWCKAPWTGERCQNGKISFKLKSGIVHVKQDFQQTELFTCPEALVIQTM